MRISKHIVRLRRRGLSETDRRLNLLEQYVDGIRVLKMNGWSSAAEERLNAVRAEELRWNRGVLMWKGVNAMMGIVAPCIVGFTMFSTYALLGGEMSVEVVFPSLVVLRVLQIFMSLLPSSFSCLAELSTSCARLQRFLRPGDEVEAMKGEQEKGEPGRIVLSKATFSRGSDEAGRPAFQLGPLELSLAPGDLCVVCGPVGSGKSTLVLGLLNELQGSGVVSCEGTKALCGQEAWIRSTSVYHNICCFREEQCYKEAVEAAQLEVDLQNLPAGEETEIGAKGINISGGQKARVALARSLMTPSDVVLLDDVLSAVDVHVATALIQKALLGTLKDSTRVVVANTFLPLLLPHAQKVLVLDGNGGVECEGPPALVQAESAWLQEALKSMGSAPVQAPEPQTTTSLMASSEAPKQVDGSLLIAEDRNVGVLSFSAYASYFQHPWLTRSLKAMARRSILAPVLVLACFSAAAWTFVAPPRAEQLAPAALLAASAAAVAPAAAQAVELPQELGSSLSLAAPLETVMLGIVLGTVPITVFGLLVSAWLQFKKGPTLGI